MALAPALFAVPGLFAEQLALTPRQTEGPFYPDRLPLDTDNDLLAVKMRGQKELVTQCCILSISQHPGRAYFDARLVIAGAARATQSFAGLRALYRPGMFYAECLLWRNASAFRPRRH